jgi:hypothetical protein
VTRRAALDRVRLAELLTCVFQRTPSAAPGDLCKQLPWPLAEGCGGIGDVGPMDLVSFGAPGQVDRRSLGAALLHGPHDVVERSPRIPSHCVVLFALVDRRLADVEAGLATRARPRDVAPLAVGGVRPEHERVVVVLPCATCAVPA